jgi:hypothetical protein
VSWVCHVRTFELLSSLRIVLVLVGVPFQRRLPVCLLDLVLRRSLRDA